MNIYFDTIRFEARNGCNSQ